MPAPADSPAAPAPEPDPPEGTPAQEPSALRNASIVSAYTLMSRVLGFVRDMLMLRAFGTGWVNGTFIIAWMVPNLLRRLLGEGALAASFLPAYARTRKERGQGAADRLLSTVSGGVLVVLTAIVTVALIVFALLPPGWVGTADAETGANAELTGRTLLLLAAILMPYVVTVCTVALYGGALNTLGKFAVPAAMPIILNVFWILAIVLGGLWIHEDRSDAATDRITILAWFLLAGGCAQLGVAGWALRRQGRLPRPRLPQKDDAATRAVFVSMLPTILGLSMVQLNTLLDQAFAFYLIDAGDNTHIYVANRLLLFPHALTSLALATAVFPQFAELASSTRFAELNQRLASALRFTAFLAVPAAMGLALIAHDFVHLFFVGGEFTPEDAILSAETTIALVSGLPFLGASQLWARAFYALEDTRTPAKIAALLVPINITLNAILALGLGFGVPGLAAATSLCAALNAWFLRRAFRARYPSAPGPTPGFGLLRIAIAAVGMVLITWAGYAVIDAFAAPRIVRLVVALCLGAGSYLGTHALMKSPDLATLIRAVRRRSRR